MRLRELLDLVKTRYDLDTDYKACKILQVSQSRVSKALKSDSIPGDDLVLNAEKLLNMPPGSLLLEMHAERTKCKKAARVLREISKQIGSAAAALMLTLSMIYATAYPTQASACPADFQCNTVYYVKWLSNVFSTHAGAAIVFFTLFFVNYCFISYIYNLIKMWKIRQCCT